MEDATVPYRVKLASAIKMAHDKKVPGDIPPVFFELLNQAKVIATGNPEYPYSVRLPQLARIEARVMNLAPSALALEDDALARVISSWVEAVAINTEPVKLFAFVQESENRRGEVAISLSDDHGNVSL